MDSSLFDLLDIDLAGCPERVLAGGRHLFGLLPEAFAGIGGIGVIGWGPQGRAQALNLRDSLAGTDITVRVGLRPGSASFADARAVGFSEADGTLGEMFDVIRDSDLVILLIADAALGELADEVFAALRPGAIIGLSHGYLLAHLQATGRAFPPGVSVIAVCPKGMGVSVRRLYEQGRDSDGAGARDDVRGGSPHHRCGQPSDGVARLPERSRGSGAPRSSPEPRGRHGRERRRPDPVAALGRMSARA